LGNIGRTVSVTTLLSKLFIVECTCQSHSIEDGRLSRKNALQCLDKIVNVCVVVLFTVTDVEQRYASSRKGRRKPSVPMEKLKTGGTAPVLNREDACKIVPSPPRVTTKSMLSAVPPANCIYGVATMQSLLGQTDLVSRPQPHEGYLACPHGILGHPGMSCERVWVRLLDRKHQSKDAMH
jgi:hypothetical protein